MSTARHRWEHLIKVRIVRRVGKAEIQHAVRGIRVRRELITAALEPVIHPADKEQVVKLTGFPVRRHGHRQAALFPDHPER